MAVAVPSREEGIAVPSPVRAAEADALPADDVLARLGSGTLSLPGGEAACRLQMVSRTRTRCARIGRMPRRSWPVSRGPRS